MQILIIVLAAALLAHDQIQDPSTPPALDLFFATGQRFGVPALLVWFAWTVVSRAVIVVAYDIGCRATLRRMRRGTDLRALQRLDRIGTLLRLLMGALYLLDLFGGGLTVIRTELFDVVLLDELIFMMPTIAVIALSWYAYYPIEDTMRSASVAGKLARGEPVPAVMTREQYVISQVRHHIGVIFVPLLLLFGWLEFVYMYLSSWTDDRDGTITQYAVMGGAAVIFICAPEVIRRVWDTVPLPAGELRERLTAMCKLHRVGVRNLLVWRTFGGMINAAVMGVFAPVRYILLTDALIERVPSTEVEAVMAHELAHVRRHHIFWLVAIAWQLAWAATAIGVMALDWLEASLELPSPGNIMLAGWPTPTDAQLRIGIQVAIGVACLALWAVCFGWVSRRFERQADTFAVQHLTTSRQGETGDDRIRPQAVLAMTSALQYVADLNHIPVARKSWRHGSILWRQTYLRTLVGQHVDLLSIDYQVRVMKVVSLLLIVYNIAMTVRAMSLQSHATLTMTP